MERRRQTAEPWAGHLTAGVCALALCVTLLSWTGKDVSPLYLTEDAFFHQPWRMLTSALPHASIRGNALGFTHVLFNVLMMFQFGRATEERLGPARTGLFYALAAITSGTSSAAKDGPITLPGAGLPLSRLPSEPDRKSVV